MFGIAVTPDDVLKARGSNFLDDMDTFHSPRYGLGVIAVKDGVQVCWGCGEPFDDHERELRGHEKLHGTVPVMLHYRCLDSKKLKQYSMPSVEQASKGLSLRRLVARVTKPFLPK